MRISDWSSDVCSSDLRAVEHLGVKPRDAERSKNFFALGLVSWMYTRPTETTLRWIEEKFSAKPLVRDANVAAFKAGHAFGETAELFDHPYEVAPAVQAPGTYTNINGNTALAWGQIGRASCRERVCQYVEISGVAGSLRKKKKKQ